MGRCEAKTGIAPFGRLVEQVLAVEPYRSAERLFWVVDNGSSHRGEAAARRLRAMDGRIVLVHTPVHASWLNQVEIYWDHLMGAKTEGWWADDSRVNPCGNVKVSPHHLAPGVPPCPC
jgi:hypothetical protein